MTVEELIAQLQQIEDKSIDIWAEIPHYAADPVVRVEVRFEEYFPIYPHKADKTLAVIVAES